MYSEEVYNYVKNRLDKECVNYKDFHILIVSRGVIFDGSFIPDDIKVKDNRVRLLIPIEDEMTQDIYYRSTEYEICQQFSTFLLQGEMRVNSDIYLLQ